MKKTLFKFAASAFALSMSFGIATSVVSADDIIATIGDTEITKEQFYDQMKEISGDLTLRSMILERVLEQKVDDVDSYKKEAEEVVQAQIETAGGEEVFEQLLAYQGGGSVEDYVEQVYVQNMLHDVVVDQLDLSDDVLKEYYENDYSPKMEAQHILVEEEEQAKEAIQRINDGEEFDVVASEISTDSSAENGGLLEPFTEGQMVPEFEEAVQSHENGEVTQEPVESQFGYHVIKVLNNGAKKPFDETKDEVKDAYINTKLEDNNFTFKIISDLLKDSDITINDEDLKGAIEDLINFEEVEESEEGEEEQTDEQQEEANEEEEEAEE